MTQLNQKYFFVFLALVMALASCKSAKEITYLQNLPEGDVRQGIMFSTYDYKLRIGDNLYIQVTSLNQEVNQLFNPTMAYGNSGSGGQMFSTPEGQYVSGYQLNEAGNVDLPIIGPVYLLGSTLAETKKILDKKVAEYFKEATVAVKLLSFKYSVIGEVATPGVFYNYSNTCTIFEALANARGTTETSKLRSAKVIREKADGTYAIDIDLTDKNLLSSPAYYLQPNDVVYVGPDRSLKNTRLNAQMYSLLLSTVSTALVVVGLIIKN